MLTWDNDEETRMFSAAYADENTRKCLDRIKEKVFDQISNKVDMETLIGIKQFYNMFKNANDIVKERNNKERSD